MAEIKVDSTQIRNEADKYNKVRAQINTLLNSLSSINNRLEKDIKDTNNIGKDFQKIISSLENTSKKVGDAATFLITAANDFSAAEMGNVKIAEEKPKWVKATAAGAVVVAAAKSTGGIGSAIKNASTEKPGFISKTVDKVKDKINTKVAELKTELPGMAKKEGMAIAAAGVVDLGVAGAVSLMRNGSFMPTVVAGASATVAALQGKVNAVAGNDVYNVGVGAIGTVGSASASADLGLIKASVSAKGYAGAVGVSAEVGLKDGTLKVGLGAALGIGGSVAFEVGLGSFVNKIDSVTNGAVGKAVSLLNNGIQVVAAPVGTIAASAKAVISGAKDFGNSLGKGDIVGAAKAVVNTGANVVKAVGNAVVSAAKAVGNAVSTVANWFKSW